MSTAGIYPQTVYSNFRILALAVIACAVWSLPGEAFAQLYVGQSGSIGEYDASTGAAINADFITGSNVASAHLTLSNGLLYGSTGFNVNVYDFATGAVVHNNFIAGGPIIQGVAVSGNTLFAANQVNNSVGAYDPSTGATINVNFLGAVPQPLGLTLSGNTLYVTDTYPGAGVGTYNATTGAAINPAFISSSSGHLAVPRGMAIVGNDLYVVSSNVGVGVFNATTGAVINASLVTGLSDAQDVAVAGNVLYVTDSGSGAAGTGSVGEYDATTGAPVNRNLITGLSNPQGIIVVPAPEPASAALLLLGCGGCLCWRRHRRH
jgi:hypothetical protein